MTTINFIAPLTISYPKIVRSSTPKDDVEENSIEFHIRIPDHTKQTLIADGLIANDYSPCKWILQMNSDPENHKLIYISHASSATERDGGWSCSVCDYTVV